MEYLLIGFCLLIVVAFIFDKRSNLKDSKRILSYIDDFVLNKNLNDDEQNVVEFLKNIIKKQTIVRISDKRYVPGIHFIQAGQNIFQNGYLLLNSKNEIFINENFLSDNHLLSQNKSFVQKFSDFLLKKDQEYQQAKKLSETLKKEAKLDKKFRAPYYENNNKKVKAIIKHL